MDEFTALTTDELPLRTQLWVYKHSSGHICETAGLVGHYSMEQENALQSETLRKLL